MKLKKLLKDLDAIQVKGSRDLEITGICSHSKKVAPGNLYVALRGKTFDGNQYTYDAVAAGAKAILTDLYDPFLKGAVQIIHQNPKEILKDLACCFYDNPSKGLSCVAITGTNGKTTTSFIVKYLLESLGEKIGLVGTLGAFVGETHFQTGLTTPDLLTTQKLLKEMYRNGCQSCIMEVSSHSLEQGRVNGVDFDITLFTNLTTEHLDYHKTIEAYFKAKSLLFSTQPKEKNGKATWAIINRDDSWAEELALHCNGNIFSFGQSKKRDLTLNSYRLTDLNSYMNVSSQGETVEITLPLIGLFNVYNAMAALSVGIVKGYSLKTLAKVLEKVPVVKGRLQRVDSDAPFSIFVDYAHTPDALEKALLAIKSVTRGKLITIFGCGGDRDSSKRSLMGCVSATHADYTIITSDNPRSEKPEDIIEQIKSGFRANAKFHIQVNREKAISDAILLAKEGDCVLIAGKGHETNQIFEHKIIPFDDYEVAKSLCIKKISYESL